MSTKHTTIPLGFEVGTGDPVALPLRHMAVTGQTQEAGKTTTLEALIDRSGGLRAVVFVTKRGEGSFAGARPHGPYFREEADWQFVASLLEASRHEKLKFERAWIIRASRGARTLADVHRNVREAMKTAKGMSADVYLTLDAYLEAIVPQISDIRWETAVRLEPGVNAMDLTGLSEEMQGLVIRSTLDWVLTKEHRTVVVVPEAWKFIPQGRGTPVKLAAERYIRQGAGLGNYLWLDSQDIAGVDKIILKSVPVWVLGVQREVNEIRRTLEQIPAGLRRPTAADVATLGLGEFFACYGREIHRTYVRPAWMTEPDARAVAVGGMRADEVVRPAASTAAAPPPPGGWQVARNPRKPAPVTEQPKPKEGSEDPVDAEMKHMMRQMLDLMTKQQGGGGGHPAPASAAAPEYVSAVPPEFETLYRAIKARLAQEAPALLAVMSQQPELVVTVERKRMEYDASTGMGMAAKLIAEGWFDEPRTGHALFEELKRRGFRVAKPSAYDWAKKLAAAGFLTVEGDGFQATPGIKRGIVEKK